MVATPRSGSEILKKKNIVKAIKNDGQTKKDNRSIAATNTTMLRCKGRKHTRGWSTMVILPPSSLTEIIKKEKK